MTQFYISEGASLVGTSVRMLPSATIPLSCAAFSGFLLTKLKRFKYMLIFGLVSLTGGMIAMQTLTENSSVADQILFQFIYSIGVGVLFPSRLMAIQAAQKNDDDVPTATVLIAFGLNLGQCFGLALGALIYQNVWDILVDQDVSSGSIPKNAIIKGNMVEQSIDKITAFPRILRETYRHIGAASIARIWVILAIVSGFSLMLSFHMKDLNFDRDTETKLSLGESENGQIITASSTAPGVIDMNLEPILRT
jgi:hypothetical protein